MLDKTKCMDCPFLHTDVLLIFHAQFKTQLLRVGRVQMGGDSGRSVQASDTPMMPSFGYKCSVKDSVVYLSSSHFVFSGSCFTAGALQSSAYHFQHAISPSDFTFW